MLYLETITITPTHSKNVSLSEVENLEVGKFLVQQLLSFSTLNIVSISIFNAERTELQIDLRYLIPN